jgi:hypothetical protein
MVRIPDANLSLNADVDGSRLSLQRILTTRLAA